MAQQVKNLPALQETQETWVRSLGWEDPLEKEMATHSIIQRVGHNRATKHMVGEVLYNHFTKLFLASFGPGYVAYKGL